MQSFYDAMTLIGSLLLIVVILVATYYASRWYARRMQGGSAKYIKILDRTPLGPKNALTIVQVGDRYYLLGIGEKSITLLSELPELEEDNSTDFGQQGDLLPKAFRDMLQKARNRPDKKDDDGGTR